MVFLTDKELVAARDPKGFRPLVLGALKDSPVIASETCALDLINAEFVREIEPGEIIVFHEGGMESYKPFPQTKHAYCIFEFIYFARPDSFIFDRNVYEVRRSLGVELAKESPVDADMVVPIPDSGFPASIGYAQASRIPLELGMIRNHYVGRTFIEPQQSIRHFGVKIKLNPVKAAVQGRGSSRWMIRSSGRQRAEKSTRCSKMPEPRRFISGSAVRRLPILVSSE